jgi:hypothetical protein
MRRREHGPRVNPDDGRAGRHPHSGRACRSSRPEPRIARLIEEIDDELIVPITILPDVDYLLAISVNADVAMRVLAGIAEGDMRLERVVSADLPRIVELTR